MYDYVSIAKFKTERVAEAFYEAVKAEGFKPLINTIFGHNYTDIKGYMVRWARSWEDYSRGR